MTAGLAIFTFFGVEVFFLLAQNNLEAGFMPGMVAACAVFALAHHMCAADDAKRDLPAPLSYRMPPPKAFAIVKKALRRFRWAERSWSVDADKSDLSIRAVCQWYDRDSPRIPLITPDGPVFRQVILDVQIAKNKQTQLTDVTFTWTVISPLVRNECNLLQSYTTVAAHAALVAAQTRTVSGVEIDDDENDDE